MSHVKTVILNQSWMIHDLVDGNQISNKEEEDLINLTEKAIFEYGKVYRWFLKAHDYFERNRSLEKNSPAYQEMEEILQEMRDG